MNNNEQINESVRINSVRIIIKDEKYTIRVMLKGPRSSHCVMITHYFEKNGNFPTKHTNRESLDAIFNAVGLPIAYWKKEPSLEKWINAQLKDLPSITCKMVSTGRGDCVKVLKAERRAD